MVNAREAAAERLGDDHRVAVDHRAVREPESSAADVHAAVGVDAHEVGRRAGRRRASGRSRSCRRRRGRRVDDHVVERAAAVLAQVGVGAHRRRRPRRRSWWSFIETTSSVPSGSQPSPDGWPSTSSDRRPRCRRRRSRDRVAVEVRRPPAAVVPARALEEVAALDERAQLSLSHGRTLSSRWRCDSACWTSRRSPRDRPGAQALQNTIDLAQLADELGYHRYWVAEHHGGPMLAGPTPRH